MSQELTVALRIKAFLTEARRQVQDFNKDLREVSNSANQAGKNLGNIKPPPLPPIPAPAPVPPMPAVPPVPAGARMPTLPGMTPGQQLQAMRQLPMQITDITTSLASGMPVYMVAIQQGGQLRDSFGSVGNVLKALGSIITPARLAIGGIGAVIAAAALAYKQGSEEQDAFNRGIIMTGNVAGTTADDLRQMARDLDAVVGTQGDAADVLAQMVSSGQVARDNLKAFTQAAIEMERAGGQAASSTVKQLTELGKAPVQATLKLNEQLHYMTAALYDQLQALMRNGQEERAAEVAQAAYAQAIKQRAAALEANLGTLERAWRGVRDLAREAWDAMLSIGRASTVEDQIKAQAKAVEYLQKQLDSRESRGLATGQLPSKLEAARRHLQELQNTKEQQDANAKTQAQTAQIAEDYEKAREANKKWADAALTKQQQLNKLLEEYHRNNDKIRAAGGVISPEQQKREERAIYEQVFGKGYDLEGAKAQSALQRATLQANLQLLQQSIKDGDAIVVQAVKDGNLSIDAAYAARLSQLQTEGDAQRRVYEAEVAEIDKALRSAKTQTERAPLLQQKVEVAAKLKLLDSSLAEGARQLGQWKKDQEQALSAVTAKIRVDVSGLTGTFDRTAFQRQLQESMRGDYEAVGRIADPAEQQAARDRLDLISRSATAQAEFNAKLAEAQRLQGQLSVTEGDLQVQQQQGTISQIEYEARLRDARAAQVPVLQSIVLQLQGIRDAMPPEARAAIDGMTRSIGELQNQAKAATPVLVDLGTRLRNTAIDGLADAAGQAVTNFKNMRSAIADTLKQIAGDIVRSGVKQALMDAFSPSKSSGGGGGGGGSFLSAAISWGKSLFGFAEGGLIRGPGTGTSDSIPALVGGRRPIAVSNHEFIQPERAVKHYGVGFMEAVRTLKLPKPGFAFGGLVAAHQRARFATGGLATAGAGGAAAPSVVVQVINQGTQQRVVDQRQQFDGRQMVVSVVLDDVARGGPISRAIGARG